MKNKLMKFLLVVVVILSTQVTIINASLNALDSYINFGKDVFSRLKVLEDNMNDNNELKAQLNQLKEEMNTYSEFKIQMNKIKEENIQINKRLVQYEKANRMLMDNVNNCNSKIFSLENNIMKSKSLNNNINNNPNKRHLLSTNNNNNNDDHAGITMNDGTSIRFVNNNANVAQLSHEDGVLKLNGTLQINDVVLDVSSISKTINVPSEYSTISAAIESLNSIHYNSVTIQLAPGTYNESIIIKDMIIPKGLTIKGGIAVDSYIINVTSGDAITVDGVNKVSIDGVKIIAGSSNGIVVKRSYVEIGTVNITSSNTGIECNFDCKMKVFGSVSIDFSTYGIHVQYGGMIDINNNVKLSGPGRSISSAGLQLFPDGKVHVNGGSINIFDSQVGIDVQSSQFFAQSASCSLHISNCVYGVVVAHGSIFNTVGIKETIIQVPENAQFGIFAWFSSDVLLHSTTISTVASSSARGGLFTSYSASVRLIDVTFSNNWSEAKAIVESNALLICEGTPACPSQGATNIIVKMMGFYYNGAAYCASESSSCNAV